MFEDSDDGARVGLWTALGVVALLLFGLIFGLAIRQTHKAAPAAKAVAMAPVAATEMLIEGPLSGDLLGKVYFETGVAALPADAAAVVAAVKDTVAKAATGDKLVLSGFHDASGDPAKNADLAKERAKAVRDALTAAGVDGSRIGLRKPESTTGDGKAEEARRVEIRLVR